MRIIMTAYHKILGFDRQDILIDLASLTMPLNRWLDKLSAYLGFYFLLLSNKLYFITRFYSAKFLKNWREHIGVLGRGKNQEG